MRICFFGDSFVTGVGDPERLGWAGRLCSAAQGCDITYYNLGVRGDASEDIYARWLAEAEYRLPDDQDGRVVFSFGVNDAAIINDAIRIDFEHSIKYASAILDQAQNHYPTLMIGPPPIADLNHNMRIELLSDWFGCLCQERGIPYFNAYPILIDSDIWMDEIRESDGAHPQGMGYAHLAHLIQEWKPWSSWILSERMK